MISNIVFDCKPLPQKIIQFHFNLQLMVQNYSAFLFSVNLKFEARAGE